MKYNKELNNVDKLKMATQIAATPTIYGEEARKIMKEAKTTQSEKSKTNAKKLTDFFASYINDWRQNNDSVFKDIESYNPQELDGCNSRK